MVLRECPNCHCNLRNARASIRAGKRHADYGRGESKAAYAPLAQGYDKAEGAERPSVDESAQRAESSKQGELV